MITTSLYGLRKPEDNDSADLRIFVGENMDILEAKLTEIENSAITEIAWTDVTGKPTVFPPSPHRHNWDELDGIPATFTPSSHNHSIAQITGLQAELDGKSDIGHSHSWTEITGKPTSFPASSHTHSSSDITSGTFPVTRLPTSIDYKDMANSTIPTSGALYNVYLIADAKVSKQGDTINGKLTVSTGANSPTIEGYNSYEDMSGLAGVAGKSATSGSGYLGTYQFFGTMRGGAHAGVYGEDGSATNSYAGYFNGNVEVYGILTEAGKRVAKEGHTHSASDITSGVLSVDYLPTTDSYDYQNSATLATAYAVKMLNDKVDGKAETNHTHTFSDLSTSGRLYASNSSGVPTVEGYNGFQTTDGLTGVAGRTASAGNGYLGTYRGGIRAGVYGEVGTYTGALAGYFNGEVRVDGKVDINADLEVYNIHLGASGSIYGNTGNYIINDHNNGNVSISAQGGDLFLGLYTTNQLRFNVPVQQEAWISANLLNGWSNYSPSYFETVGYKKDTSEVVHLKGMATVGTYNRTIFTLPSGYRPSNKLDFVAISGNTSVGRIEVDTNGDVRCVSASAGWLSFTGLSFPV